MINPLIQQRLKDYSLDVVELATLAIELSDRLPEASVKEALSQRVREIVKRGGNRESA